MANGKLYHRRPARRHFSQRGDSIKKAAYDNPRLDPQLKQTFKKIGVPEFTPFKPDPFQLEALEKIKDSDVLVSAPTGSGKTWIASQAISQYYAQGLRTWYASPLKALSNSIYLEFSREFGSDHCGILTGDRKENPDAPIVVGTTEILRNQLYDAMHEGTSIKADLVILDEAHYLSDPDRGVVWEEVLIYLPARVKLLLLSATISNAEEICSWLEENRGTPAKVVLSDERPVPLEMLFLFPDGLISPLAGKRGLTPRVRKFLYPRGGGRRKRGSRKMDFGDMITCLRTLDLLPAIFFLKSRMDCDRALSTCGEADRPPPQKERFKREVNDFLTTYPHLKGHRQLGSLLHSMVGAHHAGQLPYWKVLIEKMMNKGYLEAIFSTSTVAAGVNFPARTVVLVQSDRFNGHDFMDLTATELHQMTGRAGRRGKDNIGFAVVVPGVHQDPQLIYELKDSSPEPLKSQIHINFSMTLNLLLSHTPPEVKDLLNRSFASFQEKRSGASVQRKWNDLLNVLRREIPKGKCDTNDPFEVMDNIQKKIELRKIVRSMAREIQHQNLLNAYRDYLKPGRLFLHKNGGVYVLFETSMERERMFFAAHNVQKAVRARKRHIRLQRVPFDKVKALYDSRLSLPEDVGLGRLQALFDAVETKDLKVLSVNPEEEANGSEKFAALKERIDKLPCEACENNRVCNPSKNKALKQALNDLRALAVQMGGMGGGLWLSFKRHVRFLKETGFVDEADRLTPDGLWASKLRLDQPLLIAEAIRKGGFHGLEPEIVAGCIAPFVWDRIQELELRGESPLDLRKCEAAFYRILDQIRAISRLKEKRGFDNPPILFWPGAALYLWAKGVEWDRILSYIPVDEGDMASLIVRTADHLRQVTNLRSTHPELASVAKRAIDLILREPVLIE